VLNSLPTINQLITMIKGSVKVIDWIN